MARMVKSKSRTSTKQHPEFPSNIVSKNDYKATAEAMHWHDNKYFENKTKPEFPPNQVFKNDHETKESILAHERWWAKTRHIDDDLGEVIEGLPRIEKGPLNARIWVDASGELNILPEGGGWLGLLEKDQVVLKADIAYDPD